MKKKYRVEKNFKIVKRSCSLNRYYRVSNCWLFSPFLHTDYKGLTKKQRQSYFLEESEDASLPDDEARYYHEKKCEQNASK